MGLGTVIPTISNTIGAVVVGWGVSSLYVLVSRDRVLYSYLVYAQPLWYALPPSLGVLHAIYE